MSSPQPSKAKDLTKSTEAAISPQLATNFYCLSLEEGTEIVWGQVTSGLGFIGMGPSTAVSKMVADKAVDREAVVKVVDREEVG